MEFDHGTPIWLIVGYVWCCCSFLSFRSVFGFTLIDFHCCHCRLTSFYFILPFLLFLRLVNLPSSFLSVRNGVGSSAALFDVSRCHWLVDPIRSFNAASYQEVSGFVNHLSVFSDRQTMSFGLNASYQHSICSIKNCIASGISSPQSAFVGFPFPLLSSVILRVM